MVELWKDVCGFEGLYKVSNLGRVSSCHYTNHKGKKPIILKSTLSSTGYRHVQLYKNKKAYTVNVHRLVATAFIENPDDKPEVNHIDGNKSNNSVTNLEWVTTVENRQHALKTGLWESAPMRGRTGANNPNSKPIIQYNLNGEFIRLWCGTSEAARSINRNPSVISGCLCGNNKTGAGYIWKKLEGDYIPLKIEPAKKRITHSAQSVLQLSCDNKPIQLWDSILSASRSIGCSAYYIKKCCQGTLESVNGFKWKYANKTLIGQT